MSATGDRVNDDGHQRILGTVDGRIRGLNMRVDRVRKSFMSVYDMCLAGHRAVFGVAEDGTDLSRAEKKQTGEKTTFKLRNHVWELEVKSTPTAQNRERVGQHAASVSCRRAFWPYVCSISEVPSITTCGTWPNAPGGRPQSRSG